MSDERSGPVLRQVSVLFRSGTVAGLTDGQLLERFATRRGEPGDLAFAAIVARHGPMVLGTCKQLLGDSNDADDAFQATFLALARKAGSLRQPDRLGPWLHGVAVRRARKLREQRERRWRHERRGAAAADRVEPAKSTAERDEESAALHEELARLPEKYRAPIVLCYLQGHTHESAATALGWPLGTVRGRLARAREQLRRRLVSRGAAPAGLVPGDWPRLDLARAIVPARLAEAAVGAASSASGRWAALAASLAGGPSAFAAGASSRRAVSLLALLVLAGGVAAGGALGRRARVAEPVPAALAAGPGVVRDGDRSDRHPADGLPTDQLPGWVGDAVRGLEPDAAIGRALRESDAVYVVDIRVRGEARSVRVTGRFGGSRKAVVVRRLSERVARGGEREAPRPGERVSR